MKPEEFEDLVSCLDMRLNVGDEIFNNWQGDDADKLNELIDRAKKLYDYGYLIWTVSERLIDAGFEEQGHALQTQANELFMALNDLYSSNPEFEAAVRECIYHGGYYAMDPHGRRYPKLARTRSDDESRVEYLRLLLQIWLEQHNFRIWTLEPDEAGYYHEFTLFACRKGARGFQTCQVDVWETSFRPSSASICLSIIQDPDRKVWKKAEARSFEKEFWADAEELVNMLVIGYFA